MPVLTFVTVMELVLKITEARFVLKGAKGRLTQNAVTSEHRTHCISDCQLVIDPSFRSPGDGADDGPDLALLPTNSTPNDRRRALLCNQAWIRQGSHIGYRSITGSRELVLRTLYENCTLHAAGTVWYSKAHPRQPKLMARRHYITF
jgi:hypothetical protein